ncbi:MAG: Nucleotidyl transferase [Phycisphaerales bacterium]|nr:Nucleotidyl transferase [Phycisphaerales bacterium]
MLRQASVPMTDTVPVALLAGGLATRLRPITETIPKALVELAGRPFIDHQLALLRRNGIRRVVMCLGYLGERVRDHCGDGRRYDMELAYSFDGDRLMGTGGAIARARHLLGSAADDPLWVMYGDSYMDIDYQAVLDAFLSPGAGGPVESSAATGEATQPPLGLMTVLRNGDRWDKSNVVFRDGVLVRYDKRNKTPDMQYIDYGVGLLRTAAVDRIPTDRPFDLADLYTALVAERRMVGYEVTQRFYEIGTPESLAEARAYLQTRPSDPK